MANLMEGVICIYRAMEMFYGNKNLFSTEKSVGSSLRMDFFFKLVMLMPIEDKA